MKYQLALLQFFSLDLDNSTQLLFFKFIVITVFWIEPFCGGGDKDQARANRKARWTETVKAFERY